jgi:hypothetical protein
MSAEGRYPVTKASAFILLAASLAMAAGCFLVIVRRYRKLGGGFPWLISLGFAAAAIVALAALRSLIGT